MTPQLNERHFVIYILFAGMEYLMLRCFAPTPQLFNKTKKGIKMKYRDSRSAKARKHGRDDSIHCSVYSTILHIFPH